MSKKRKKNHSNKNQANSQKAGKTEAAKQEESRSAEAEEGAKEAKEHAAEEEVPAAAAIEAAEEVVVGSKEQDKGEETYAADPKEALLAEALPQEAVGHQEENKAEGISTAEEILAAAVDSAEETLLEERLKEDPFDDEDLKFLEHEELSAPEALPEERSPRKKSRKSFRGGAVRISRFTGNKRFILGIAISFGAVLLFLIVLAIVLKDRRTSSDEGTASVDMVLSSPDGGESLVAVPADPLLESEDEALYELMWAYFKAREEDDIESYKQLRSYTDSLEEAKLQSKSEFIEAYRNLKLYTKPGPYENSFMVYVSYDLKLKEFEQTVPAVETLVVCEKESEGEERGELYVYSGGFDESVVDYIRAVTAQEDVEDLFRRVDAEYKEIIDSDADYAAYMSSLKQLIRDGVSERLAAAATGQTIESDTPTPTEEPKEETVEDTNETAAGGEFEVEVTDYVNVRASDSENADRIGNVGPGTKLTCKEQLANGWSRVIYEGKDAYIKSDYLVVVNAGDSEVIGKVTVTETVNIRARADKESQLLGTAYAGTSYDQLEKDKDGWTKILYNGKEAYVKSEYVKEE